MVNESRVGETKWCPSDGLKACRAGRGSGCPPAKACEHFLDDRIVMVLARTPAAGPRDRPMGCRCRPWPVPRPWRAYGETAQSLLRPVAARRAGTSQQNLPQRRHRAAGGRSEWARGLTSMRWGMPLPSRMKSSPCRPLSRNRARDLCPRRIHGRIADAAHQAGRTGIATPRQHIHVLDRRHPAVLGGKHRGGRLAGHQGLQIHDRRCGMLRLGEEMQVLPRAARNRLRRRDGGPCIRTKARSASPRWRRTSRPHRPNDESVFITQGKTDPFERCGQSGKIADAKRQRRGNARRPGRAGYRRLARGQNGVVADRPERAFEERRKFRQAAAARPARGRRTHDSVRLAARIATSSE